MFSWTERFDEHLQVIRTIRDDASLLAQLDAVAGLVIQTYRSGGKLLICGNGGSASDAQHIAGELVSRFYLERPGLYAEALTANVASMTAISNDYSYERIFQRQVEANGRTGDLLIGLSTSGNSRNVVLAMEEARRKKIITVGITGSKRETAIEKASDYSLRMPSSNTPRVQEATMLVAHTLCEIIEARLFQ